jgi:hypothetical protein
MSYKNDFSTYRIAYALSKLHLWDSLLKLDFLFSAIALQKKAPASILFGYSDDHLCKCSTTGRAIAYREQSRRITIAEADSLGWLFEN